MVLHLRTPPRAYGSRGGRGKKKRICSWKEGRVKKTLVLLVSAVCLLLPSVGFSEVKIAKTCRIANQMDGRCGWSALETLARHHGIKSLYGVGDKYPANT